ncbi:MAG: OmpA family protein [Planctomycetota bacterium]
MATGKSTNRMRGVSMSGLVGLGLMGVTLSGGCVNQAKYDELEGQFFASQDRNAQLARENDQLRDALDQQNEARRDTRGAYSSLEDENARLRDRLAETNALLEQLDSEVRSLSLIDPTFDQALRALAAQYPNVIIYDSEKGMLRFASDLTFSSGSDAVQAGARQTLSALAQVIKANTDGEYELQIVGHTDAEAISASTAQRHPTNTHLSVHRAIAVKRELVSMGLPSNRVLVAGWGESRPAVPNNPGGNTPQNRRVEILFRPATSSSPSSSATATVNPDAAPVYTEPTK